MDERTLAGLIDGRWSDVTYYLDNGGNDWLEQALRWKDVLEFHEELVKGTSDDRALAEKIAGLAAVRAYLLVGKQRRSQADLLEASDMLLRMIGSGSDKYATGSCALMYLWANSCLLAAGDCSFDETADTLLDQANSRYEWATGGVFNRDIAIAALFYGWAIQETNPDVGKAIRALRHGLNGLRVRGAKHSPELLELQQQFEPFVKIANLWLASLYKRQAKGWYWRLAVAWYKLAAGLNIWEPVDATAMRTVLPYFRPLNQ